MSSTPVEIWNPAGRLDPLYHPEDADQIPVNLQGAGASGPTLLYPRGLVIGEITAVPGLFAQYDPALADGSQTARMILRYACGVIGAAGAVGSIVSWVGEWPGVTFAAVPAFMQGAFDLAQLIGLDATALASMAGAIREGALGIDEIDSIVIDATSGTWGLTVPSQVVGGLTYPAAVVANTALAYTATATATKTAVNAALHAAGIPASVTVTGGPGATNPIVLTFHGVYGGHPIVITTDATLLAGNTHTAAITRSTNGVAPYGVVRFQ